MPETALERSRLPSSMPAASFRQTLCLGACRIYPGGAGIAIAQLCRSRRPGPALSSFGQFCPGSHCTINILCSRC